MSSAFKKTPIVVKTDPIKTPSWLMLESCAVCKTPFRKLGMNKIIILPCLHKFNADCVAKMAKSKTPKCAICKKEFSASIVTKKTPIIIETPTMSKNDECSGADVINSDEEVSEDSSEGSLAEFVSHDGCTEDEDYDSKDNNATSSDSDDDSDDDDDDDESSSG